MEQGDTARDIGERERLIDGEDSADKAIARNQPGWEASGRSSPFDIYLSETTDIGHDASPAVKFDANLEAIRTLKLIQSERRNATPEEQVILSRYSGFGDSAFTKAFPGKNQWVDPNSSWTQRRESLEELTTPEEFQEIERSRLTGFFTSPGVIKTLSLIHI